MAFWFSMVLSLLAGLTLGGWSAVRLARRGDFESANRRLKIGAWVAGICATLGLALGTGWPFIASTESVVDQVSKTVRETVEVPMEVTSWWFWKRTEMRIQEIDRTVQEPVVRATVVRKLSWLSLIPLVGVGWLGYQLQFLVAWIMWRRFGTGTDHRSPEP